ncbi:PepSY domain-containing protein [Sphingomonas sp. MMS24-JH45]
MLPTALAAPQVPGATGAAIEMQGGRPRRPVTLPGGAMRRADVASGRPMPGVGRGEAIALARAAYRPAAAIASATRFAAEAAPLDLRRARPSWQVAFSSDGTRLYVDADTGSVLAIRTPQWRAFDWMWGLHIMDLGGREDTSHAVLIGSAALALVASVLGMALLPLAVRRRR